jgi:lipoyl(octanoyl) transferase
MSTASGEHTGAELWVCQLGTVPYLRAVAIQERVREARIAGALPDTLLLLEHPPVYTRGRRSADAELLLDPGFYRDRGIDVVTTDRGGRITYHGPGQLVGYPVMRVGDVHGHLRTIEAAIVAALAGEGVEARARVQDGPDYTGVWVGRRKIASIGVHVSRGVATHGFAVNVDNELEPFSWIVSCGLADVSMTSLAAELARAGGDGAGESLGDRFRERIAASFCAAHGRVGRPVSPRHLGIDEPGASGQPRPAAAGRGAPPRTSVPA